MPASFSGRPRQLFGPGGPLLPVLAAASFLLIGWSNLLVPSLVRSIEHDFAVSDAVLGAYYLVYAVAYAAGSVGGGLLTERLGRRAVLGAAGLFLAGGLALEATTSVWVLFTLGGLGQGLGSGAIDGGVNGLFLDLFASERSGPLMLLHLFFSLGALAAPVAIGTAVDAGTAWQTLLGLTAGVAAAAALCFLAAPLPAGRHQRSGGPTRGISVALPLVLLGLAIGAYVAAEAGVSSWLVRFLAEAPLPVATSALSLFWAGIALGRLVSARLARGTDPSRFAAGASVVAAIALVAAVVSPWLPVSIACFGLTGLAFGPVYPLIMAIAGNRYPARAAAVSGLLAGAAVAGSVVYPPLMGVVSVTLGLAPAMLGAAVLSGIAALAVRQAVAPPSPSPARPI